MKAFYYLCLGLLSCSPWEEENTSLQVPIWINQCETISEPDSILQNYVPKKCTEIRPNCTLHVNVYSDDLLCRKSQLTWDVKNESLAISSEANPLSRWMPWSQLLNEMTLPNADLPYWWQLPINENSNATLFHRILMESLLSLQLPDSLPSTTIPWSYLDFQDTLLTWIDQNQLTREDFLAWNARQISISQLQQELESLDLKQSNHYKVGSCDGAASFHVQPELASADSYLRAHKDSEQLGYQVASLAQWKCLLGEWNDSFPIPRNRVIKWRGLSHLQGNRYWLSDTTTRGYRLLFILDTLSSYQLEEIEPSTNLLSTKYLQIQ